ncbi:MAG: hypothetical protein A2289_12090 [Deltaproteobacteria bacterium RIFOXYA12_FULL_58_15]|nr:MAG: hypothetical protein A2289_12090 [Deltaproteobacteria bacterium RIFOXYA12_FULL_58_15]OGR08067.1 MAG: hypothetical protein A2341_03980 [Deltaproteobacteria bacterium RIFOXYB12_FULL_58_9]
MSHHETDDFDRLAGQPDEPIAATRELLAATGGHPEDASMEFGPLSITDVSPPRHTVKVERSPLPWIVVVIMAVLVVVLVFAFVMPTQGELRKVKEELDEVRQAQQGMREQNEKLERERDDLLDKNQSLLAEGEERQRQMEASKVEAATLDAQHRLETAAKDQPPPKATKPKRRKKGRKR